MELTQNTAEEQSFCRTFFEILKEEAPDPETLELARELARRILEGEKSRL